jgi:hypothetical protein
MEIVMFLMIQSIFVFEPSMLYILGTSNIKLPVNTIFDFVNPTYPHINKYLTEKLDYFYNRGIVLYMAKQKYPQSVTTASGEAVKKGRESYSSVKLHAKRDRKRQEAAARDREYQGLSVKDRIARATARGGSVRELARLQKLVKAAKTVKMTEEQRRDEKNGLYGAVENVAN